MDNTVFYLDDSYETSGDPDYLGPGWYFRNECDGMEGPAQTAKLAEENRMAYIISLC